MDHVFDAVRQILYISTSSGRIERYDLASGQLLSPFFMNGDPRSIDTTADGAWIYVADALWGPSEGFLRKIGADAGAVTSLPFVLASAEAGGVDIAIGSSGLGHMTTQWNGNANVYLRALDVAGDRITVRHDVGDHGRITPGALLYRSADRATIYLQDGSETPMHLYDAPSDTFIAEASPDFVGTQRAAVSRAAL